MSLSIDIVTPNREIVSDLKIKDVTMPGALGEMCILPGHRDLISNLEPGILRFNSSDGKETYAALSWGYVEVKNDHITLLAETLESQSDLDLARAQRAKAKAEEMLTSIDLTEVNFNKYQLKLQRALVRIQVAQK